MITKSQYFRRKRNMYFSLLPGYGSAAQELGRDYSFQMSSIFFPGDRKSVNEIKTANRAIPPASVINNSGRKAS